jgi:glycosyltransferase involved in cell wall biosynthesis
LLVGNFLSGSLGTYFVCEDLAEKLEMAGWKVVRTSMCLGRTARIVNMVCTAWRQRNGYEVAQVDVYSGNAFIWAEAVCFILRRAKRPYILTLHGGNLPAFARKWPRRVGFLLRSAAVVTTPSQYLLEKLAGYRKDMRLMPNPINLDAYRFKVRKNPNPCLIWLRAFHDIYNPSMAVRAVGILAKKYKDIELVMIGPDKKDGSMLETKRIAAELGIADKIKILGAISKEEIPNGLSKGDIFLNTTNADNTPVSVLEAMACGLCVVSTNVGGIPYLLEDEIDALLVQPDNEEAMALAVHRILSETGLAERLSINGRNKVERFDWSGMISRWDSLLTSVAKEKFE